MKMQRRLLLTAVGVAALALTCFAKIPVLTGKMVAYDPLLHASKNASVVANKEVVILQTQGPKTRYVKVVFVSFGTSQIDAKYFDGTQPLTAQAIRDKACDESYPEIVAQVTLTQRAGTYLLTDTFKNSPPGRIKNLECYDATGKK